MERLKNRAIGAGADRVTVGREFFEEMLHGAAFCCILLIIVNFGPSFEDVDG